MALLWKNFNRFLNKNELILLLLLVALVLRLPSLFEPFWYGDENIYLAIGQGIRKGLTLYDNIADFPNKPPLIYLFAALTQSVSNFRLLLLFWNLINVVFFFLLVKLVTKHQLASIITTLIFIFLTSTPLIEGNIANAEMFFIMPTTIAVWLLFKTRKSKKSTNQTKYFFTSGILLGLSFLFKIHVLLDIAAIGLFFLVFTKLENLNLPNIFAIFKQQHLWFFVTGLALPVITSLLILTSTGVSPTSLFSNATGSTSYISVWNQPDFLAQTLGFGSLLSRTILLGLLTLGLFISRKKILPSFLFITLWLLFTLFAALLSARPYPHYLIQPIPPLLLGLALLFTTQKSKLNKLSPAFFILALGLVVASFVRFDFGLWPVTTYYKNFANYITGQIDRNEYYRRFDSRMPRNYQLANYLRQITSPQEKIYIWGTQPGVYTLAGRNPVEKLVASFHVQDLNYFQQTIQAIKQDQTNIIIVMESEPRDFPQLKSLLATDYLLIKKIGDPNKSDQQNSGNYALVYNRF